MQSTQMAAQAPPPSQALSGRSGRLKYAEPRDLPSFPSHGFRQSDAAASAAASLGWANQKTIEPWKPGNTAASASAAALLAKDYKAAPSWEPAKSGSDIGARAAILAAGGAVRRKESAAAAAAAAASPGSPGTLSPTSTWGNSAANQAFKASVIRNTPKAKVDSTMSVGRSGSLRAAKGAMAAGRPRAKSTPVPRQTSSDGDRDSEATHDRATTMPLRPTSAALTAATTAHKRTVSADGIGVGGAVPYTTMSRQMFTSHPPLGPEADDQKRADVLHASAVAMAKRIYSRKQHEAAEAARHADSAAAAAGAGAAGPGSPGAASDASYQLQNQPAPFVNLQEAAYRLAQDRLARLQDEHQRSRDYQEYYGAGLGAGSASSSPSQSRFGIRAKLRRRSSSDGAAAAAAAAADGKGRASPSSLLHRRRASLFFSPAPAAAGGAAAVGEEKRQRDREALLAAARRNVKAQLEGMDRKVYEETGKVAGSMLEEKEVHRAQERARAAAQTRSEAIVAAAASSRGAAGDGKIDIGGGRLMDRSEIDEIAARRVQPFLDEINEKAERERERIAKLRAEEEERRREVEAQKARDREVKEIHEKLKNQQRDQERARKEEIKHEERVRKEAEKEAKAETKRHAKEEKHASKDVVGSPQQPAQGDTPAGTTAEEASRTPPETSGPQLPEEEKTKESPTSRGKHLHLRLPGKLQSSASREKGGRERARTSSAEGTAPVSATTTAAAAEGPTAFGSGSGSGPSSPTDKVKNWFKSRFRPRAKSSAEPGSFSNAGAGAGRDKKGKGKEKEKDDNEGAGGGDGGGGGGASEKGFIGGAALAAATTNRSGGDSLSSLQKQGSGSMRDVALAGREEKATTSAAAATVPVVLPTVTPTPAGAGADAGDGGGGGPIKDGVAGLSSSSSSSLDSTGSGNNVSADESGEDSGPGSRGGDRFVLARDHHHHLGKAGAAAGASGSSTLMAPPRPIRDPAGVKVTKTGSPVRDSRFLEMME